MASVDRKPDQLCSDSSVPVSGIHPLQAAAVQDGVERRELSNHLYHSVCAARSVIV